MAKKPAVPWEVSFSWVSKKYFRVSARTQKEAERKAERKMVAGREPDDYWESDESLDEAVLVKGG